MFTRLFKEYRPAQRHPHRQRRARLPAPTLARLSQLSAWWVRLGMLPELIEPGKPQQNGRHERMHRTLKAETTRPPAHSCRGQQRQVRPLPAGVQLRAPARGPRHADAGVAAIQRSPRAMPSKLPPLEYPDHFEVRYVSANGGIRWNEPVGEVSTTCCEGEYIGLEEIDDGMWNVYFGPLKLGDSSSGICASRMHS